MKEREELSVWIIWNVEKLPFFGSYSGSVVRMTNSSCSITKTGDSPPMNQFGSWRDLTAKLGVARYG